MANSAEPRIFAIIPAAGIGSRFSAKDIKQYAQLLSATVLEHSAATLLALPTLQRLVIAVHHEDTRARVLPQLNNKKIHFVVGGVQRTDSVLAALAALKHYAADSDWVLVHDAARPCLTKKDLLRMVEQLSQDAVGGILAVPAVDTLKAVSNHVVLQTVDREMIWQAQTPQMFRFGLLLNALQLARDNNISVTDEASAMEAAGYAVRVVEGARSNIKITYPEDVALAAFYLQQESST